MSSLALVTNRPVPADAGAVLAAPQDVGLATAVRRR
jgi:hypothetical protein